MSFAKETYQFVYKKKKFDLTHLLSDLENCVANRLNQFNIPDVKKRINS